MGFSGSGGDRLCGSDRDGSGYLGALLAVFYGIPLLATCTGGDRQELQMCDVWSIFSLGPTELQVVAWEGTRILREEVD